MVDVQATRGFEIRQIKNGQRLGSRGFALEIIDGGVRAGQNKLQLYKGNYGADTAYTDEGSLRCWPGNRIICDYDAVGLARGNNAGDIDTVTFKSYQLRNAIFTDTQPTGMTRKRWLTRGTTSAIGATFTQLLYMSNDLVGAIDRDDYYTDSRLTDLGYFDGWIASTGTFNVWIMAALQRDSTNSAPTMRPIAKATATDRVTGFPTFSHTGGGGGYTASYSYNFTWGSTGATSTVNVPVPVPGSAFEIHVENTSAGNLTFEYAIGVRGQM